MEKYKKSWQFHGRTITVENGEIAKQAGGSVLVRYDDTVVLSTATASHEAKDTDFFPLTVVYQEKMYAAGKIPGGFLRREGRPTEHATLTARLIDRPIRPLFAEGFRNEVQVVNTVFSSDPDCSNEMASLFGSSLALCVSDIPFNGPVAGVKVGKIGDEYIINPTVEQMEQAEIDLTVAGTKQAINMVEAGAKEVSEDDMLKALMVGHEAIKELCAIQEEVIAACAKPKMEVVLYEINPVVREYIDKNGAERIREAVSIKGKLERYNTIDEIINEMADGVAELEWEDDKARDKAVKQAHEYGVEIEAGEVRRLISEEKIRPDGRALDELRPLDSQVDLLPRVHGSAMFTRGETQVMSITTLGPLSDAQEVDDLTPVKEKRFMHQYNFPPFSVGEVGRMGSPGRREIGHGALGERALKQVLPSVEEFPYAIRTCAEVLESNGSSSQASICAGTMSLMAAGVPIKAMVAGVAMGLITVGDTYSILTDIQGMEDHYGDMDFKVAGTRKGITALQMDIKVTGISYEILKEALAQAHKGRMEILDNMETAIGAPRDHVSKWAPKYGRMTIPTDKIRIVIGKGGEQIDKIIEECDDIKIDIDDGGNVVLYHTDQEMIDKAMGIINDLVREAKVGDVFDAKVIEVRDSYAFVNLFGSTDALLHVSDLSWERVEDIKSVLHVGDTVKVKVTNVDESGKVKVSMKALMEKPEGYVEPKKPLRPQHGARGDRRHFSGEHKDQGNVEKRVFRKKSEE
ncbi:MAG: polyribonucleotide nucleotidyltransferase [Solobacterium sp.]|jgi:polyribonucleotide nucleotidyltransferase|nr:polyribonucleotide nucleotidyltransferase [Solobacterium sp.]MCH4049822.1 polyribonucleotide nucleotidyltransferase [Solobacterium sp.]MCH4073507.1 polyribonucleotide nucleotidyltransferase [Solobacterium sp.]MCI1314315.1 polyribonucleotide nucleotidyltransferase [Solobacterium sp.]MCI1346482.1 polyribonucleotide nucleotidyltransferase [Solobacterium sp.]